MSIKDALKIEDLEEKANEDKTDEEKANEEKTDEVNAGEVITDEENTEKEKATEDKTAEENSSQYMETEPIPDIAVCDDAVEDEFEETKRCDCNSSCKWTTWGCYAIGAAVIVLFIGLIICCVSRTKTIHLVIEDWTTPTVVQENQNPDIAKQFHLGETKAKLGIECMTVDQEYVKQGLPNGVYVVSVQDNGSAQISGILEGDIIVGIDGKVLQNTDELVSILNTYNPGDIATVSLVRYENGQIVSKNVVLVFSN